MTTAEDESTGPGHDQTVSTASKRARWATIVPFLIIGTTFSSYYVRMPSLQLKFGLSDGQLGLLLMLTVLGGVLAMQLAGGLVARFGSAVIVRISMVAMPASIIGLAMADDLVQFAVALLVFGALDGLMDVSMNAHAVAAERHLGRSIMNSCHAGWSIGAMVGSGIGGLLITAGLTLFQHYLLAGVVLAVIGLVAGRFLLPASIDRVGRRTTGGTGVRWRAGWTRSVLVFGLTGTVVLVVEGAVGNWSGIFLHDDLGATLALASLGYICFNICQAGGRVIGDRLKDRFGARTLAGCGGLTGAAGLALVVVSPVSTLAIVGFGLIGLGTSVLVPIIFSAVGHRASDSDSTNAGAALAKVNTLTYTGQLVSPVVVGWAAQGFGLTTTFGGLLVLLVVALGLGLRAV